MAGSKQNGCARTTAPALKVTSAAVLAAFAVALFVASPGDAAAACAGADAKAGTVPPAAAQRAVRCLINRERAARGLRTLVPNKALEKAARKHSKVEDRTNCMAHQCPGEDDLGTRVQKAGFPGCDCKWRVGEVIGWRRGEDSTPRAIVEAWMESPAHRSNLLRRSRREIGAGVVYGSPRANEGANVQAAITTVLVGSRKKI